MAKAERRVSAGGNRPGGAYNPRARQPLQVALVDSDESVHAAVKGMLIEHALDWTLQSYTSAGRALERIPAAKPAAVFVDVRLPGPGGVECAKRLLECLPDLHVVMLTSRADRESVLGALVVGARGYLTKPTTPQQLVSAASGRPAFCPEARRAAFGLVRVIGGFLGPEVLTDREDDVALCIALGMNAKAISSALPIAYGTARLHIASISKKLGVHGLREARRKCLRALGQSAAG
jgi:DNA-binding NarL/FixJ family response regulator